MADIIPEGAPIASVEPVAPEPSAPITPVEPTVPVTPVEPAPVAPVELAAPVVPVIEPSILEAYKQDDAGVKPPEPAAPAEPTAFDYKYDLPEFLSVNDDQRGEIHKAFDAFRTDPAAGAQALVDLHAKQLQTYADFVASEQMRVWNETRKGWRTEVMADEQLGGAGHQTALSAIARMRDMLVPESDRAAFTSFLQATGAGDHPAFLRMLHNAARFYDEPPMPPSGIKPPPSNGKAPKQGVSALYTHPTSSK